MEYGAKVDVLGILRKLLESEIKLRSYDKQNLRFLYWPWKEK